MLHCRKRRNLRYGINAAATHPRIRDEVGHTFVIRRLGRDSLQVLRAETELVVSKDMQPVGQRVRSRRLYATHLVQGIDLTTVDRGMVMGLEVLLDQYATLARHVKLVTEDHDRTKRRLARHLREIHGKDEGWFPSPLQTELDFDPPEPEEE
jgi:hypothetical protein